MQSNAFLVGTEVKSIATSGTHLCLRTACSLGKWGLQSNWEMRLGVSGMLAS